MIYRNGEKNAAIHWSFEIGGEDDKKFCELISWIRELESPIVVAKVSANSEIKKEMYLSVSMGDFKAAI